LIVQGETYQIQNKPIVLEVEVGACDCGWVADFRVGSVTANDVGSADGNWLSLIFASFAFEGREFGNYRVRTLLKFLQGWYEVKYWLRSPS
jgi:hypothetical protein